MTNDIKELSIEIKIQEKYFKIYTKKLDEMKKNKVHFYFRYQMKQALYSTRCALLKTYSKYMELLTESNSSNIILVYQSRMNDNYNL